jgi:hypothetical protein
MWMIEHHSPALKAFCSTKLREAGYEVRVHEHTGYAPGSAERDHHGYLIAEPPTRGRRAQRRQLSWAGIVRAIDSRRAATK